MSRGSGHLDAGWARGTPHALGGSLRDRPVPDWARNPALIRSPVINITAAREGETVRSAHEVMFRTVSRLGRMQRW